MTRTERVGEGTSHHVDGVSITHPCPPAHRWQGEWGSAHDFDATRDGDASISQLNCVCRRHDRLQSRAAEPIQCQCRRRVGHARPDSRNAGDIHISRLCMQNLAQHDLFGLIGIDACSLEGFPHNNGRQIAGRYVFERPSEGAYGGSYSADDHHFLARGHASLSMAVSVGSANLMWFNRKCQSSSEPVRQSFVNQSELSIFHRRSAQIHWASWRAH
ncbi:hypothetical protein D3C71_1176590 [compost metagenome]